MWFEAISRLEINLDKRLLISVGSDDNVEVLVAFMG